MVGKIAWALAGAVIVSKPAYALVQLDSRGDVYAVGFRWGSGEGLRMTLPTGWDERAQDDKLKHMAVGMMLAWWSRQLGYSPEESLAVAVFAGSAKEIRDTGWVGMGRGNVEFGDWAATAAGGIFCLSLERALSGRDPP